MGQRVEIGVTIAGRATPNDAQRYSVLVEQDGEYAVFLAASAGTVQLAVLDSQHFQQVAQLSAGPTSGPLLSNATPNFPATQGTVLLITIGAQSAIGFEFQVYAVNPAPERRAAQFSIGDTVVGEDITPVADVDNFWLQGQPGQDIVVVPQPLGPAGTGTLLLTVTDTLANSEIGYAFNDAGSPSPRTTARMRLHSAGAYRFQLRGVEGVNSNVAPRYHGPYRFWSYAINRAPEHRSAILPVGAVVSDERIDRAGDVDEFSFQASAGASYNAFVQSSRTVQMEVAPDSGPALAVVQSSATDTSLFASATGRFTLPQGGTYLVRVFGTASYDLADTGAYRLYVYAIDPRPEHVPATLTPGDTVTGEDIALPGDIDEFTFGGSVGEEFNAFLQAQNGRPETQLRLEVLDGNGTVLRTVDSFGTDTTLLRQVTGRFALPASGTYRLRVSDLSSSGVADYKAPYRLFLYRINRHPESSPDTLAFGDSLSGEAMDVPGDVDEFRVRIPDSSGANLAFALDSQPVGGSLTVQLIDSATGQVIASGSGYSSAREALGRMRLAPGTYIVRADGNPYEDHSVTQGGYRLWFYHFGYGPETAADTFAVGDTVSGESIDPWGDEDRFHFHALQNQHVNILVQGLSAQSDGGLQFFVTPPPGAPAYGAFINSPTAAGALEDHQSARVDLPTTGWYTVDVSGFSEAFANRGPYRFSVLPIDPGPEHVSAALSVGDSVVTEPIDAPGDVDEFTVTATPGQDLSVIFDGRDFAPYVDMWIYDPATFDTLAFSVSQFHRIAGPFKVPGSGQFKIAVLEPRGLSGSCYDATCGGVFRFAGTYGFHVVPVNRAPENGPAAYAIGDTVRGETISPVGDIDEFTASGTPGEQLTLFDRLTVTASLDSAIVLEVIDPATGTSLVGSNTAILGSSTFFSVGSFTVPASGTFIVRAHVYGEWGFGVGTTSYEFFVSRP